MNTDPTTTDYRNFDIEKWASQAKPDEIGKGLHVLLTQVGKTERESGAFSQIQREVSARNDPTVLEGISRLNTMFGERAGQRSTVGA